MLEPLKKRCQLNFSGDIKIQEFAIARGSEAVLGLISLVLNKIFSFENIDLSERHHWPDARNGRSPLRRNHGVPRNEKGAYCSESRPDGLGQFSTRFRLKFNSFFQEHVEFQEPENEWAKKIEELVTMSQFLLHHGYSQGWRTSLLAKLEEIRPIVRRGSPDSVSWGCENSCKHM